MNSVFTAKLLNNLKNKKGNKGFTLIELLVVVIIIGVLAAVALPNLLAQVGKARESEGKTGVGTITRAQQTRHFETGNFEDEDNAGFGVVADNNLSISVASEYFEFVSDAAADGATSLVDGALVVNSAIPPSAAVAQANGTRAFGTRMDFNAGNYASVMCQQNAADGTFTAITAPAAAGADPTCTANTTTVR